MSEQHLEGQIAAVASLTDPTRKALYDYVQRQQRAVGRDESASATGISRSLAAYHLDRLVESGLLEVRFERPAGRRGPGAGRPAKLYQRRARAVEVSVPRRNYALAARAFAEVMAQDECGEVRSNLLPASRRLGRAMAAEAPSGPTELPGGDVLGTLEAIGYQPYMDEDSTIRLRNCLFEELTKQQRELTCTMNLGLIEGVLEALGDEAHRAQLDPGDERCCVAIIRDAEARAATPQSAVARERAAIEEQSRADEPASARPAIVRAAEAVFGAASGALLARWRRSHGSSGASHRGTDPRGAIERLSR